MRKRLFISLLVILFPSVCISFTYTRIVGSITTCVPGPETPWQSELALGCNTLGDAYCEGDSFKLTPMWCPDTVSATNPAFTFVHVGATPNQVTIVNVPLGTENDVARTTFETWAASNPAPDCPSPYLRGASGDGYMFTTSLAADGVNSDLHLHMYKRSDCSMAGDASTFQPIPVISGGGGGGGATDMTATNTKLDTIAAGVVAVKDAVIAQGPNTGGGGGGTVTVDMTGVETRLDTVNTGITTVGTKLDGISTKLDGVYTGGVGTGSPADKTAKETAFFSSSLTNFSSFQTSIKATPFYNSIGTFFNGVPSGGTSVFSVNGGRFGNHTLDLADYGTVWNIIKALVLISCSYVSIKIIFLGRA